MSKIIIKNTHNADSRTADENLTKEQLYEATELHREDVARGMKYIAEQLIAAGQKHDWTKIKYFDQYAEDVLSEHTDEEFKSKEWYNLHIHDERHHVTTNAHPDLTLIDCIEHAVDCIMAGKGRFGDISSEFLDIPPEVLYRAYWGTIRELNDIVEVSNAEELNDNG